jgi:hypothetical protein
MEVTGRCYCGAVHYKVEGEPTFTAQCHCRECQYLTGGAPNMFMVMPASTFTYTQGEAKGFTRTDIENAVTREFCPECGTHLLTRAKALPDGVVLKVGTMDDPGQYPGPQMAIYCMDKQSFHEVPEGVPEFDRFPG